MNLSELYRDIHRGSHGPKSSGTAEQPYESRKSMAEHSRVDTEQLRNFYSDSFQIKEQSQVDGSKRLSTEEINNIL